MNALAWHFHMESFGISNARAIVDRAAMQIVKLLIAARPRS